VTNESSGADPSGTRLSALEPAELLPQLNCSTLYRCIQHHRGESSTFGSLMTLNESAYPAHLEILCTLSKEES